MTARDLLTLARDLTAYNTGIARSRAAYWAEVHPVAPTGSCADCHNTNVIQSRGLCSPCYQRNRRAGLLKRYPRSAS